MECVGVGVGVEARCLFLVSVVINEGLLYVFCRDKSVSGMGGGVEAVVCFLSGDLIKKKIV